MRILEKKKTEFFEFIRLKRIEINCTNFQNYLFQSELFKNIKMLSENFQTISDRKFQNLIKLTRFRNNLI
jgi:hypothetical protein